MTVVSVNNVCQMTLMLLVKIYMVMGLLFRGPTLSSHVKYLRCLFLPLLLDYLHYIEKVLIAI